MNDIGPYVVFAASVVALVAYCFKRDWLPALALCILVTGVALRLPALGAVSPEAGRVLFRVGFFLFSGLILWRVWQRRAEGGSGTKR